jgi:hypothetical protein
MSDPKPPLHYHGDQPCWDNHGLGEDEGEK